MTLVFKLDLDIVTMCVCTKMKLLPLTIQKLQPEQIHRHTDGQTDTQTDRLNLKYYLSAYVDGKNFPT